MKDLRDLKDSKQVSTLDELESALEVSGQKQSTQRIVTDRKRDDGEVLSSPQNAICTFFWTASDIVLTLPCRGGLV